MWYFFFFNDPSSTDTSPLPLHDALPTTTRRHRGGRGDRGSRGRAVARATVGLEGHRPAGRQRLAGEGRHGAGAEVVAVGRGTAVVGEQNERGTGAGVGGVGDHGSALGTRALAGGRRAGVVGAVVGHIHRVGRNGAQRVDGGGGLGRIP